MDMKIKITSGIALLCPVSSAVMFGIGNRHMRKATLYTDRACEAKSWPNPDAIPLGDTGQQFGRYS